MAARQALVRVLALGAACSAATFPASRGRAGADVPGHYDELTEVRPGSPTFAVDSEVMATHRCVLIISERSMLSQNVVNDARSYIAVFTGDVETKYAEQQYQAGLNAIAVIWT